MPMLTPAQWDAVRRVAAEQGRTYVEKNYGPDLNPLIEQGFHMAQIKEILRIASGAASKAKYRRDEAFLMAVQEGVEKATREAILERQKEADAKKPQRVMVWCRTEGPKTTAMIASIMEAAERRGTQLELIIAEPRTLAPAPTEGERRVKNGETWYFHKGQWKQPVAEFTNANAPAAQEGDTKRMGAEIWTFFLGTWRTRSELEGFVSAKKYL